MIEFGVQNWPLDVLHNFDEKKQIGTLHSVAKIEL